MFTHRLFSAPTAFATVFHMPATDLTSYDPMFKDDYHAEAVMNSLQDENEILAFMTKEVVDMAAQGRKRVIPKRVGRNHSTGSIGTGALPSAGRAAFAKSEITLRDVYTRVQFDAVTMDRSRNDKGAFEEVMALEMQAAEEDLAFRRNVIAWGYGKGILAKVNGTHSNTTTLEVKDPLNVTGTMMANRYLKGDAVSGMTIAILDGTTPTTIKGVATITAVNSDGTDVTLDTAITAANGDLIVIAQTLTSHSYDKEPEGLLAGVDDGTYVDSYHGISRTTYAIEKASVFTSVGALSLDAFQQWLDAVNIKVGGSVDMLAGEHGFARAYMALLEADRRYTGADLKSPDGGTKRAKKPSGRKAITFGDLPILVERDAPYGMCFGLKKDTWLRLEGSMTGWADTEGSVLKWVDGFDAYTAFFRIFENFHCLVPARNFRAEGISTNQLLVSSF